ncbi:MAG: hypothetical protein EOM68_12065 [Spirochaetia bacterium]|nr:hypothetical protein [Spirochaetia bacterium]
MNLDFQMLIPRWNPLNRDQKRLHLNEYARLIPHLRQVDNDFLYDLLISEEGYRDIYTKHLEMYLKRVKWMNEMLKPTCFRINEDYFVDMYKPLEDEVQSQTA